LDARALVLLAEDIAHARRLAARFADMTPVVEARSA
jgi:hypothetical protein